ncbi:MAG TPA: SMP-30/gluconolactonase/LRE family protein [Chthoniobacterales bacterium]
MFARRSQLVAGAIICVLFGIGWTDVGAADDPSAQARATLERIQALRKERPNDGVLIFYEAFIRAGLGERESAFDLLRGLKGRKLGLVPYRDGGFDAVWDDPKFQAVRKELADEEPRTPNAPVAFRLKDPRLIPEGIAFDRKSNRFFLGSLSQRKIIVTDEKGNARDFSSSSDKLDAVLGLTVDTEREHLYAVTTNGFEDEAKTARRNAVFQYDLKSSRLINRFPAAEAKQLNDLAVATDGTLYATDSMSGTLFRKKPDETTLTRFGETGALRGANGVTLSPDGKLYVTLSTGIAQVNTATGEPTRLPQPDTVVTGGIDGLYWHGGDLLGVQNGTNPGRVIRIALGEEGTCVSGLTVLQSSHHPEFAEPTTGAIGNDALYVIGNSYVGHYQSDRTIKDADKLKGTAIVAVPVKVEK